MESDAPRRTTINWKSGNHRNSHPILGHLFNKHGSSLRDGLFYNPVHRAFMVSVGVISPKLASDHISPLPKHLPWPPLPSRPCCSPGFSIQPHLQAGIQPLPWAPHQALKGRPSLLGAPACTSQDSPRLSCPLSTSGLSLLCATILMLSPNPSSVIPSLWGLRVCPMPNQGRGWGAVVIAGELST